jgi:hypothetical protein
MISDTALGTAILAFSAVGAICVVAGIVYVVFDWITEE